MAHLMENTLIYRAWQAPFAERKLAPLLARVDVGRLHRVLDVGCGPGTNYRHFAATEYLGVDINPAYIRDAERRFGPHFRVMDVTTMAMEPGQGFDCILVNSLLHHLSDEAVDRLLGHLGSLLAEGGAVHILELVLPARQSVARFLARHDRGDFPRPLEVWRSIFSRHFSEIHSESYFLRALGVPLWEMVYFQGARTGGSRRIVDQ